MLTLYFMLTLPVLVQSKDGQNSWWSPEPAVRMLWQRKTSLLLIGIKPRTFSELL